MAAACLGGSPHEAAACLSARGIQRIRGMKENAKSKAMVKGTFCGILGGVLGVCAGIAVHCSFMSFEIDSSAMLPALEPGQKVLVFMAGDKEQIKAGDMVACRTPYYTVEGDGPILVRRVVSTKGEKVVLQCDAPVMGDKEIEIPKKDIIGEVVLH